MACRTAIKTTEKVFGANILAGILERDQIFLIATTKNGTEAVIHEG